MSGPAEGTGFDLGVETFIGHGYVADLGLQSSYLIVPCVPLVLLQGALRMVRAGEPPPMVISAFIPRLTGLVLYPKR